jgi:hypothetical protein
VWPVFDWGEKGEGGILMNTTTANTLKNDIESYLSQGGNINRLPGYKPKPRPPHRTPTLSNAGVETGLPKFGSLPDGWLTKEAAAAMLEYRVSELTYAARTRKIPAPFKCVMYKGQRTKIWKDSDLTPFVGIPYKKLQTLFSLLDMTSGLRVNKARIMKQVERGRIEKPRFLVREKCGEKFIAVPAWLESEFIRACSLGWEKSRSVSEFPEQEEKYSAGVIGKSSPGTPWKQNEIKWLVNNYERIGSERCAEHTGRSSSSVRNKIRALRKNGVKIEPKALNS